MQTLQSHTDKVSCCVWSRDDRQLLTAGNDKAVKLWDVQVRFNPPYRQRHMSSVAIDSINPSTDGLPIDWDTTVDIPAT